MADLSDEAALKTAAERWSRPSQGGRTRWWTSPAVHRHINRIVCGKAIDGPWAGLQQRMREMAPEGGFGRAISVGAGHGGKELELLHLGLVQQFDVFEISGARVEQGRERAEAMGIADRVKYNVADAFRQDLGSDYDLVYWNNALHHMMDVPAAVRWSRDRLKLGGAFVMDDYVGASRFQWSDYSLRMATRVRKSLPDRYLVSPADPSTLLPRKVKRPDEAGLIAFDPTEAADSDAILPSVRAAFPGVTVIPTGGAIYHTALNDVLANFDEDDERDLALLNTILLIDQAMARSGETQYAVALATKRAPVGLGRRVARRLLR